MLWRRIIGRFGWRPSKEVVLVLSLFLLSFLHFLHRNVSLDLLGLNPSAWCVIISRPSNATFIVRVNRLVAPSLIVVVLELWLRPHEHHTSLLSVLVAMRSVWSDLVVVLPDRILLRPNIETSSEVLRRCSRWLWISNQRAICFPKTRLVPERKTVFPDLLSIMSVTCDLLDLSLVMRSWRIRILREELFDRFPRFLMSWLLG